MELVLELLAENPEYQRVLARQSGLGLVALLQRLLAVQCTAVRVHARAVCRWHAVAVAGALYECAWVPTALLRAVLPAVPRLGLPLPALASLADYEARQHTPLVGDFLRQQRDVLDACALGSGDARARACLCASAVGPGGDPAAPGLQALYGSGPARLRAHLAHCAHVAALVRAGGGAALQLHIPRALALAADMDGVCAVPNTVLDVVRALTVVDWTALLTSGTWQYILAFVRVHVRQLRLPLVQARVVLRDASRALGAQARARPASGRAQVCRDFTALFLQAVPQMLDGADMDGEACGAAADAVVGVFTSRSAHLHSGFWQSAWGVMRTLRARGGARGAAALVPRTCVLLDAHAAWLCAGYGTCAELLTCGDLCSLDAAACVHLLRAVVRLHAARSGAAALAALCEVAARGVRALDKAAFRAAALADALAALGTSASALVVAALYMPDGTRTGGFSALKLLTEVLQKETHRRGAPLAPVWAACAGDTARTLDHLIMQHKKCLLVPATQRAVLDAVCTLSTLVLRRKHAALGLGARAVECLLQVAAATPQTAGLAAAYALHAAVFSTPRDYSVALVVRHCERAATDTCPCAALHSLAQVLARVVLHAPLHGGNYYSTMARFTARLTQDPATIAAVARGALAAARGGHTSAAAPVEARAAVLAYMCPLELTAAHGACVAGARLSFAVLLMQHEECPAQRGRMRPHFAAVVRATRGTAPPLRRVLKRMLERDAPAGRSRALPRSTPECKSA